jgi:hypothetical protein
MEIEQKAIMIFSPPLMCGTIFYDQVKKKKEIKGAAAS